MSLPGSLPAPTLIDGIRSAIAFDADPSCVDLMWRRVRRDGNLIAMAGERLHPPGWTEISAVCTDADYRGQGLATRLVHAVAYAPREALTGDFVSSTSREAFAVAHDVSSYSLTALTRAAAPLMAGRRLTVSPLLDFVCPCPFANAIAMCHPLLLMAILGQQMIELRERYCFLQF